jgi:glycerol dehydrogenase-like iron-containing ADH family enzyme
LRLQTTLADWKIASKAEKRMPVEPELEKAMRQIINRAIESAPEIGRMNQQGIKRLVRLLEDSAKLIMANLDKPIGSASEHLFGWNLGITTGRHFIHVETVALGILISSHLQKEHYAALKQALDDAQVRYHPKQLELSWDEIKHTLLTINEYNQNVRHLYTIFDETEWTPELLEEIRELVFE